MSAARSDTGTVKWLRAHAVPLAGASPEIGLSDLEPLRRIVGDARVVLLGQATHGTREFFQLGHRIIEYLVTRMGFRVLMIEAFWSRGLPVNDYLLSDRSSVDTALAGLGMWIWDTYEVRDLLTWLHEYNRGVPDHGKVRFYGIDMQDGWSSMRAAIEYLREVDPDYAMRVASALAPLDSIQASYETVRAYGKQPPELLRATAASIAEMLTRLRERRQAYIARSSSARWAIALQHATILAQAHESWSLPDWPNVGDLRDRFMADNVARLLEAEDRSARVIVWAHNAHVARGLWARQPTLGWHLAQRFGSKMVVFGFAFNRGSLQAWDRQGSAVVEHTVGPAAEGTVSATMALVGLPLFLVDFRRAPGTGPISAWLSSPHLERTIGSGINSGDTPTEIVPREVYDAMVFVDRTTRARPTPTGRRPRP
ncbi:MAG: erythromycin esterase family protein [Acidobacteriota bacterium]